MSYLQGNQYDEFLVRSEQLTGIADALREKTGDTAEIPFADWEGKIRGLSSAKVYIADHSSHSNVIGDYHPPSSVTSLQMQFVYPMPEWAPDIIYMDYEYKIEGYRSGYSTITTLNGHGRAFVNYYSRAAYYAQNDAYSSLSSQNIKRYYDPKYVSAKSDSAFSDCPHVNAQNDSTITLTELFGSSFSTNFTSITNEQFDAKIIAVKF